MLSLSMSSSPLDTLVCPPPNSNLTHTNSALHTLDPPPIKRAPTLPHHVSVWSMLSLSMCGMKLPWLSIRSLVQRTRVS
jgi:hypothetical protein